MPSKTVPETQGVLSVTENLVADRIRLQCSILLFVFVRKLDQAVTGTANNQLLGP